jgi:nucleoside-diphosphate-sugar epimerase
MANTIEACKRAKAKLVFLDNVYMYGRVAGPMTEGTPHNPCSKKGEVRARIATMLLDEVKAGSLEAMIARAPDFYGPETPNGVANVLVFEPFSKGSTASWLVDADVPHSLIYTPDAARGVAMLADRASAWNQVWHLPTTPTPPNGRELITIAATEFGVKPKFRVLGRAMLWKRQWLVLDVPANSIVHNRDAYEAILLLLLVCQGLDGAAVHFAPPAGGGKNIQDNRPGIRPQHWSKGLPFQIHEFDGLQLRSRSGHPGYRF